MLQQEIYSLHLFHRGAGGKHILRLHQFIRGKTHALQPQPQLRHAFLRSGRVENPLVPEIQIAGIRRGLRMIRGNHQHLLQSLNFDKPKAVPPLHLRSKGECHIQLTLFQPLEDLPGRSAFIHHAQLGVFRLEIPQQRPAHLLQIQQLRLTNRHGIVLSGGHLLRLCPSGRDDVVHLRKGLVINLPHIRQDKLAPLPAEQRAVQVLLQLGHLLADRLLT